MPHKRAKASIRKARKEEVDLPVANGEGGNNNDTPKGFFRLLKYKEMSLKKQKEKKDNAELKKKDIKIQPGERMKDFVERVEHEYQTDVIKAQKAAKPMSNRKKRNQETRKEKKKQKVLNEIEKYGGKDFDDLKDNVKFGEVVDAPPIFNKLPKARGKQVIENKPKESKEVKEASTKSSGYESEEDENMKALKASHKRKLQNMSAAARIQLDNEREKVIEAYRAKKAKKVAN